MLGPAGGLSEAHFVVRENGEDSAIALLALPEGARRVRDKSGELELRLRHADNAVEIETQERIVRGSFDRAAQMWRLALEGERYDLEVAPLIRAALRQMGSASGSGAILATMPGVVAEVKAVVGERVEPGQIIVVLESMKLFLPLTTDVAGVIKEISCRAGETVQAGRQLVVVGDP